MVSSISAPKKKKEKKRKERKRKEMGKKRNGKENIKIQGIFWVNIQGITDLLDQNHKNFEIY